MIATADKQHKISDRAQKATDLYITNVINNPKQGYTWTTALREAKYAESTIDKHPEQVTGLIGVKQQIEQAKASIKAKSEWELEQIDQYYEELRQSCILAKDRTNLKGCLDSMSRRRSGFTDNIADGRDKEAKPMTPAELTIAQEQAKRIVDLKLKSG